MIKIKIQNTNSSNHLLSDVEDAIFNKYIKPTKERLESKLKDAECDIHKSESKGTITLKSTDNKIEFAYSDFCCDDFKEKFRE